VHLLRHPRNAAMLGLIFVTIAVIYFTVPTVLGLNNPASGATNVLDVVAGATMLLGLGIAMALMAYVIAVGTRE
jgi:hypothetical protein